jgi:MFS family permease
MSPTRSIIIIIAAVTAMGLSLSLSIPLVSLSLERREFGADIIGLMGALPALSFIIVSPFVPRLTRMFGSGALLWLSLILCSASILGLALDDSLLYWFVLRVLIGIGMSILFLISETWINQVSSDKNRGKIIGLYVMVLTLGFAMGPVVINFLGTEGTIPFIAASMIVASAGIFFLFAGRNYPKFDGHSSFSVFSFIRIAPLICAAALLVSFFDGTVLTLLPVYGVRHAMSEETAVLMTSTLLAGNILLQFPIGMFADKFGEKPIILICGLFGLAGAISLPFLITTEILLWPVLVLWGGCVVGTYTLALILMGRQFTGAELITANATAGVLWGVGSLAGPAAGGYAMKLSDSYGMPSVFVLICFLFVCLSIWELNKKSRFAAVS